MEFLSQHWLSIVGIVVALFGLNGCVLYYRAKDNKIRDIQAVLTMCRECKSWDDVRSELKLYSWLEGTETDLHRKSLRALRRIELSVWDYWSIHVEMDEDRPPGTYFDPEGTGRVPLRHKLSYALVRYCQRRPGKRFYKDIINLFIRYLERER